jgi:hypothetical protein
MITNKKTIAWASLAVVLLGCVLGGGVLWLSGPREPSYAGKSLSAWIVPFAKQTPNGVSAMAGPYVFQSLEPVRHAVREMGTNAVPFLIARMNTRERVWHRTLRELAQRRQVAASFLSDPAVGQIRAIRSLAILGTNATEAIPGLVDHLTNNATFPHAVYALTSMGAPGLKELLKQMTNQNPVIRTRLRMEFLMQPQITFGFQPGNDTLRDTYLAAVLQYAQDPEPSYRLQALTRLRMLGVLRPGGMTTNDLVRVVPVLLQSLGDTNVGSRLMALHTLESLHPPAEMVVGTLTNYLTNSDMIMRVTVSSMLRRYGLSPGPVFSARSPMPPPPAYSPRANPAYTNFFRVPPPPRPYTPAPANVPLENPASPQEGHLPP